ncbi:tetratricopeptide repeat protein [Prosthecobacter sp.]|jgi:TPR repeat protein|uniref:tetratricopeptide repeat protein n=1 Tax=Prosthecobacter sp. TaxID=1965333 RepID=UPI003784EA1A
MLLTAIKLKLAAMVAVAGLDTAEMPGASKEFVDVLTALEAEQKKVQANPGANNADINKAFNEAVAKVRELAQKDDKDATYALAHWGVLSGANINEVAALYRKAADKGQVLAKSELAQVLMQAGAQNPEAAKEAIKLIKEAEAADNKVARRMLAQLHLQGVTEGEKGVVVVEKSVAKAKELLEKGNKAGDGEATLGLAQLYSAGVEGVPQDHQKALDLLIEAGKQGNAVALSTYGARLLNGDPDTKESPKLVKKDVAAALKMFNDSAEKGLAAANRILGQIYENGVGQDGADVKQDVTKAFEYYTKAANGSDPQALFRLGNAFETGIVKDPKGKRDENGNFDKDNILIQPNPKSALDLYRLAAQNNLAEAFYNVGVYYETGTVVDKDPQKAFAFHMKAATAGIAQAMNRLAGLYANGTGTTQDLVAAAGWYQRAADMGFAPAQIALGILYEQGAGVRQSRTVAAGHYSDAAQQGNALAMLRLANLYAVGVVPGTPELARAWAYAKQADELAQKSGNKADSDVTANVLKQLEDKMKPDEVTEAKKIFDKLPKPQAAGAPAAAPAPPAAAPAGDAKKKK